MRSSSENGKWITLKLFKGSLETKGDKADKDEEYRGSGEVEQNLPEDR